MQIIPTTKLRSNLAKYLAQVQNSWEPLIISTPKSQNGVLISLEHWNSLQETAYLLDSPANAERLQATLKSRKGELRELIEA